MAQLGTATVGDRPDVAGGLLVGLAAPQRHEQPAVGPLEVIQLERDQFAATHRRGEAEEQQRPVAEGLDRGAIDVSDHRRETLDGHRGLPRRCRTDLAADALQGGAHELARGGRLELRSLVRPADGSHALLERRHLAPGGDLGSQEGSHGLGGRGQHVHALLFAPAREGPQRCAVGTPGRRRERLVDEVADQVHVGRRGQRIDDRDEGWDGRRRHF
jgi:hypothetical protein